MVFATLLFGTFRVWPSHNTNQNIRCRNTFYLSGYTFFYCWKLLVVCVSFTWENVWSVHLILNYSTWLKHCCAFKGHLDPLYFWTGACKVSDMLLHACLCCSYSTPLVSSSSDLNGVIQLLKKWHLSHCRYRRYRKGSMDRHFSFVLRGESPYLAAHVTCINLEKQACYNCANSPLIIVEYNLSIKSKTE